MSAADFKLSVLDELTPGEAALLEHFRALPLHQRRALLDALDRAAKEGTAGSAHVVLRWDGLASEVR